METRNTQALDFLLSRCSCTYKILTKPIPDRKELETFLTAAARSPDHGCLEPWRFIVIEEQVMPNICSLLRERGLYLGKNPSLVERAVEVFSQANLIVAVVAVPDKKAKIPAIEQTLSAGAVCLALLNAALAAGWGANWLTGFGAHDPEFRQHALGLKSDEYIAGFVHIGTASTIPSERPRPDLEKLVSYLN